MDSSQIDLFKKYRRTASQWSKNSVSGSYSEDWPVKRIVLYQFGVVRGKYAERDLETMRIIAKMSRPEEEEHVKQEIRQSLQRELQNLEDLQYPDKITNDKKEKIQGKLAALLSMPVQQWAEIYGCTDFPITINPKDIPGFLYLEAAYSNYKYQSEIPWSDYQHEVESLYQNDFDKNSQFLKYGLLPVDETRELLPLNPPRLYDRKKDRTLILKGISKELAESFRNLMENGQIKNLALRASGEIFLGKEETEEVMEEIERGRIFSLVNLPCGIARLYSQNYEDALWVIVDETNITFEELCENFQVNGDNVVTQVIHLQYRREPTGIYITHLDQEYIFYTEDEFDVRRRNPRKKGAAHARLKSFKIDSSRISFDFAHTVQWKDQTGNLLPPVRLPFLCYVLDCYFQHKDLLQEYFQNLTQPD